MGWAGPALGTLVLAVFGWFNWVYLRSPLFLGPMSHLQPQIADVSWYFATGRPVYHGPDSAEVYNLLYGPWLYIVTGWFEKILGGNLFAAKLPGTLALGGAFVLLFLLVRRRAGSGFALLGTGMFATILMALDPVEILGRTDVFILLCVVTACWVAESPLKIAPVLFGVLAGICFNLKIHAPAYFVPLLWPAWRAGRRWGAFALAAGSAMVMAVLPFVIFPNVSWANFWWTLRTAGEHGFDPTRLLADIGWFFMLSLPVAALGILAYANKPKETAELLAKWRPELGLILATFILVLPFASKYGSGPHHLLPLAVFILMFAAELAPLAGRPGAPASLPMLGVQAALYSWLVTGGLIGASLSHADAGWLKDRTPWAQSIDTDLDKILAQYQSNSVILMGVGEYKDYPATFFRTQLVFAGMPDGLEPGPLMENAFAGKPAVNLPAFTHALELEYPGKKILWLVPKGDAPFALDSYYARVVRGAYEPNAPLFDDEFRKNFAEDFHRIGASAFYDLYSN